MRNFFRSCCSFDFVHLLRLKSHNAINKRYRFAVFFFANFSLIWCMDWLRLSHSFIKIVKIKLRDCDMCVYRCRYRHENVNVSKVIDLHFGRWKTLVKVKWITIDRDAASMLIWNPIIAFDWENRWVQAEFG